MSANIYITLGNIPKTRINYYYSSQKDRRAKAGNLQQNSRSALSAVGDPTEKAATFRIIFCTFDKM